MAVQGGTRSPMAKCDVESTPEIDDGEQKKLAALFAMCDVNGTGHLDKAAIADLLETKLKLEHPADALADGLLAKYGDGNKLSLDEFASMIARIKLLATRGSWANGSWTPSEALDAAELALCGMDAGILVAVEETRLTNHAWRRIFQRAVRQRKLKQRISLSIGILLTVVSVVLMFTGMPDQICPDEMRNNTMNNTRRRLGPYTPPMEESFDGDDDCVWEDDTQNNIGFVLLFPGLLIIILTCLCDCCQVATMQSEFRSLVVRSS